MNLTTTRLAALRYLALRAAPVYVCALADEAAPRVGRGYSRQQATRTGAGIARPLIVAGLAAYHDASHGWGLVSLTDAGRKVLKVFDRYGYAPELADALLAAARSAKPPLHWGTP